VTVPAFGALNRAIGLVVVPTTVMSYVVLRPDLTTTLAPATTRTGHELKDTGLHAAFAQLGDLEGHAIDTAGLDAAQTAAAVQRAVMSGGYRLQAS
jgi:gluconate kinase